MVRYNIMIIGRFIPYFLLAFMTGSCVNDLDSIDNYEVPGSCLYGQFIDMETREKVPLPVEGETGVKLRLFESAESDSRSIDFYAKTDGTFKNSRLFKGEYNLVVEQAPFVQPDTVDVNVEDKTEITIEVMPYARISAKASVDENKIVVEYYVQPTSPDFKIQEIKVFLHVSPYIDGISVNHLASISEELSSETDFFEKDGELSGHSFSKLIDLEQYPEVTGKRDLIIGNNSRIYVRIGALCNGEYNYSQVIPVKISL